MAFTSSLWLEVENGGADGTAGNGGGFDAGVGGFATDAVIATATSASCTVTSASDTSVAGDVGHWMYLGGTGVIPGFYQITAQGGAGNTGWVINATAGQATLSTGGASQVTGCGTSASLSGITWSIDYSQKTGAAVTYSDLSAAGAGSTFTSAAHPFTAKQIGNIIAVSGGANCTVQRAAIISLSGSTATFDKAVTTGAATVGAGKLGGCFASGSAAGAIHVGGGGIWVKYNAAAFVTTSTASNLATGAGRITLANGTVATPGFIRGYETVRGDATNNIPTLQWGVNAASNPLINLGTQNQAEGFVIDCNRANFTSTRAITAAAGGTVRRVVVENASGTGILCSTNVANSGFTVDNCEFINCDTNPAISITGTGNVLISCCVIHDNTADGINSSAVTGGGGLDVDRCEIVNCKNGASNSGIVMQSTQPLTVTETTIYGSGSHGIDLQGAASTALVENCHFESNGGYGINVASMNGSLYLIKCGFYNNTSGKYPSANIYTKNIRGEIVLTSTAFNNAAGGDFGLNNVSSGGAMLRAIAQPTTYFKNWTTKSYSDVGGSQHQDLVTGTARAPTGGRLAVSGRVAL